MEYIEGILKTGANSNPTVPMQQLAGSSAPPGMDMKTHDKNGFNVKELEVLSLEKVEPAANASVGVPIASSGV